MHEGLIWGCFSWWISKTLKFERARPTLGGDIHDGVHHEPGKWDYGSQEIPYPEAGTLLQPTYSHWDTKTDREIVLDLERCS